MSESSDWKEKYLSLVERQETEAAEYAEAEKLLCRAIIRLTLATSGLDPTLDPTLRKLRDTLRRGFDPSLKQELNALSDTLMRGKEGASDESDAATDLLPRLLARAGLKGKAAKRLRELAGRLQANPEAASDAQLDELLMLLTSRAGKEARAGLFARILKGKSETSIAPENKSTDSPNRVLLNLLEKLEWPGRLTSDISALKGRLESDGSAEAWVLVLEKLSKLVMELFGDVQSEIQATEHFLSDLTMRLNEIEQHISGNQALRDASRKSGHDFSQAMKGDMDNLRQSATAAKDLKLLQQDIAARVDSIQQRIDAHIEVEEQRLHEAEETEQQLRDRLRSLEKETEVLQSRVTEVHHQALKDAVTGLPNRMAYEERLAHEYAVWKRNKGQLALLVWDVDSFKQINDCYGHQSGDKALRVIGKTLSERPRESDFVGRYGGEEFVMLLVGSPLEDVVLVAEQIRESVANMGFHSANKQHIAVTISCGISEFKEGDEPHKVFQRADKALYQAKREGKNRCVVM
jgi:diguanylate cyclase